MESGARRRTSAVAGLVLVALGAGACTDAGGSDAGPEVNAPASVTRAAPTVATEVSFGTMTGKLAPEVRKRLSGQVAEVVDGWFDAAYVAGDYPRRDFSDAWPGFTTGAQQDARHDQALMSNEDIGATIEGVEATRRWVRLDVLAVKKRPVGVTAHVRLVFTTSGRPAKDLRVAGRLYLTPTRQGWRVFGYDITKGDA